MKKVENNVKNKNIKNVISVTPTVFKDLESLGLGVEMHLGADSDSEKYGEILMLSEEFKYGAKSLKDKVERIMNIKSFNGYVPGEFLNELISEDRLDLLGALIEADKILPQACNIEVITNNMKLFNHANILNKLSPLSIKEDDLKWLSEENPDTIPLKMLLMDNGRDICNELEKLYQSVLELDITDESKELSRHEVISVIPDKKELFELITKHLVEDDYEYSIDLDQLLMYSIHVSGDIEYIGENRDTIIERFPELKIAVDNFLLSNNYAKDLETKIKYNLVTKEDLELPEFYDTFVKVITDENTSYDEIRNLLHYALSDITILKDKKEIANKILSRFTKEILDELVGGDEDEKETI